MAKKPVKAAPLKKADKEKVQVKYYGFAVPAPKMKKLIELGCAGRLKQFGEEFRKVLIDVTKVDKFGKEASVGLDEICEIIKESSEVLGLIEDGWNKLLGGCDEKCKKPETKKPAVGKKKTAAKGDALSNGEKEKIRILRKGGMPIKSIGKAIKRAEKVVSQYVHSIEKGKKKA